MSSSSAYSISARILPCTQRCCKMQLRDWWLRFLCMPQTPQSPDLQTRCSVIFIGCWGTCCISTWGLHMDISTSYVDLLLSLSCACTQVRCVCGSCNVGPLTARGGFSKQAVVCNPLYILSILYTRNILQFTYCIHCRHTLSIYIVCMQLHIHIHTPHYAYFYMCIYIYVYLPTCLPLSLFLSLSLSLSFSLSLSLSRSLSLYMYIYIQYIYIRY